MFMSFTNVRIYKLLQLEDIFKLFHLNNKCNKNELMSIILNRRILMIIGRP